MFESLFLVSLAKNNVMQFIYNGRDRWIVATNSVVHMMFFLFLDLKQSND